MQVLKKRPEIFGLFGSSALFEMLCSSIMDGSIHNIEERKRIDDIVDSFLIEGSSVYL